MTVSAARLAQVFVELVDTRDDEFDLSAFLQLVTARAAEVVGAEAAGLLLADTSGQLQFVAGSDETTAMLELFQAQHHEGPCLECFHSGQPVMNADLSAAADRWPKFAPLAVTAGFHAVHALPMHRDSSGTVGAMSLFQTSTGQLGADDIQIVQSLTDLATLKVLQERTIHGAHVLTDQLQGALTSRVVIEQAKGVIAQMRGISVDDAFDVVRALARRERRPLAHVAQAVVDDPSIIT